MKVVKKPFQNLVSVAHVVAQVIFYSLLAWHFWLHASTGFLYIRDFGSWMMGSSEWFLLRDYTRLSPHFFNGLYPWLASGITKNSPVLIFLFGAAPLLTALAMMAFLFLYLRKTQDHLIFALPLILTGTILRGFIYTELIYACIFWPGFLILYFSEKRNIFLTRALMVIFFTLTLLTHQAVIFLLLPFIVYLLIKIKNHEDTGFSYLLLAMSVAGLTFHLFFIINPIPPTCEICRNEFKSTLVRPSVFYTFYEFIYLLLISVFYSKSRRIFFFLMLLGLAGLFFLQKNAMDISDYNIMWNNRVASIFSLAAFSALLLLVAVKKKLSSWVNNLYQIWPYAGLIFLIPSFAYLLRWQTVMQEFNKGEKYGN